ncbi:oxidoreductase [Capsaspora owczarzaki ATCC 30864]|uniref:Oxidoreductase n=2 Tax=Capsaspora owczarzaki (strain ATCC 30864) TaxID=595528 RepID=A0A0D2X2U5_CAPO3|nr:oxidoreductase [Capsaspora owczarzaki ATCC 30864]
MSRTVLDVAVRAAGWAAFGYLVYVGAREFQSRRRASSSHPGSSTTSLASSTSSSSSAATGPKVVRVTQLWCFPIKACAGTSMEEVEVDRLGVVDDRRRVIVDPQTHKFITQRQFPRMALIRPSFDKADGHLVIDAPGMPTLHVVEPNDASTPRVTVTIWGDSIVALPYNDSAVTAWLTEFIGAPAMLVKTLPPQVHSRPVETEYDLMIDGQPAHAAFSDGYPFLLASEESLVDLNNRLANPVPILNFRPNIVVAGAGNPWAEDTWQTVRIGTTKFGVVKSCARCSVPTVDVQTGIRDKTSEPTKTLRTFRTVGDGVMFGQNLIHYEKAGRLRVGDLVEVMATDDHHQHIQK